MISGKRLYSVFVRSAIVLVCGGFLLLFIAAADGDFARIPLDRAELRPFPSFYFTGFYRQWMAREAARPYWAPTELENSTLSYYLRNNRPLYFNNDILAFYGHPNSPNMGILGRYAPEELAEMLDTLAREYDALNGNRGVRKALYLIYGTVQPQGRIGYIPEDKLQEYLRFALEYDMLVFIDHQIGRYDPVESLEEMLPWLRYPNVHLALDPEWRTDKPMKLIGSVTAGEINRAQERMSRYLTEHRLPGERMLVIHQFNWQMIQDREDVRTGYDQVTLVHCTDGLGEPAIKRHTYSYNALAKNMPVKGFKLFYNFNIPGAGYDNPLLTPEEVFALNPRPCLIMYQ